MTIGERQKENNSFKERNIEILFNKKEMDNNNNQLRLDYFSEIKYLRFKMQFFF